MGDIYKVIWTNRSLKNAINIKNYLSGRFSLKEVTNFEKLLKEFETIVSHFPTLYSRSVAIALRLHLFRYLWFSFSFSASRK